MKRTKRKAKRKVRKAPKVKRIVLRPAEIVQVAVPPTAAPIIVHDPVKSTIEIIPAKLAPKQTWRDWLFGQ